MSTTNSGVRLCVQDQHVVLDNGIVQITLSNPAGIVTGIQYNNVNNLLQADIDDQIHREYWDLVWAEAGSSGTTGTFDIFEGTDMSIIVENEEQVEISFTRKWDPSLEGKFVSINLDKRFIMLRNCSGFYTYAIFEHLGEWPPFNLPQIRVVFKLRKDKFHYMVVGDNRQRFMPHPDDRLPERCQPLDFPEAVLLVDPLEPEFKGEVDDKYEYSSENRNLKVHGWISFEPPVGFWHINPSSEFRSGGPLKQNLTSHVGPYTLAMFLSAHYGGEDLVMKVKEGEAWTKVFGPVFIYLNSVHDPSDALSLWDDAKQQMLEEVQCWPYDFPASLDFPPCHQRGQLTGTLLVCDSNEYIPANGAYVGLAPPGDVGSWQTEGKGYQFWCKADENGNFCLNNVRMGDYNLYAWVPGFLGDYRNDFVINITAGCDINLGELVYKPPRHGPTLWEIGIPDRSAGEFYIPDPNPKYINKLYVNHPDRFRQYGLWERYAELYPDKDLVYTVGVSDYTKDWFFAHVNRKRNDGTYEATTWEIKFKLDKLDKSATYKLHLALATANVAELQIRVNDAKAAAMFTTGEIGHDNAIGRHGIHGLYRLYGVEIQGSQLVEGSQYNSLFLTQTISTGPVQGLMYDYFRFDAPPTSLL